MVPGAEVLAHDVGRRRQPLEQVPPLGAPQVAGDAAPPAALDGPGQRVVGPVVDRHEGPHGAHEVALAGELDLDHVGPELAEQARAERRGDARADVDHPDAGERPLTPGCSCARFRVALVSLGHDLPHGALRLARRQRVERGGRIVDPVVRHEVVLEGVPLAHQGGRLVDACP